MVPRAGLEPARIAPHAPQTCAATNYATSALVKLDVDPPAEKNSYLFGLALFAGVDALVLPTFAFALADVLAVDASFAAWLLN